MNPVHPDGMMDLLQPQQLTSTNGGHSTAHLATSPRSSMNQLPALDSRTQLFVGNLPFRVRWQDLKDLMRKCGTVLRADVALTPGDGRSRGFGIVLFAKREDALKAIEMYNGFNWQNRTLDVRIDSQDPTGAIAMAEANRLAAMQHSPAMQSQMPLSFAYADTAYQQYQQQLALSPAQQAQALGHYSPGQKAANLMAPPISRTPSADYQSESSDRHPQQQQQQHREHSYDHSLADQGRLYPPPGMMLVPISMMGTMAGPAGPPATSHLLHPHQSAHLASHSLQGYYHAVQHRPSPSSPVPLPPGYANRHLFIGNLPFNCQWQELKDLMRGAGNVLRADIAQGSDGRSRGFGSVLFATPQDAERAVQMFNGFDYNGRALKVHFDKFSATTTAMPQPHMPYMNPAAHPQPSLHSHMMQGPTLSGRSTPQPSWYPGLNGQQPLQHLQIQDPYAHSLNGSMRDDRPGQEIGSDSHLHSEDASAKAKHGSAAGPPGSIELPPPNPFAFSMLTGGIMSPRQGNIPPMTPSMPAFTLGAFPSTPPVYPQFFSPGLGPASPHHQEMPGASYFSGGGIMGSLNAAPGAPVDRNGASATRTHESYFPETVPPGEDVPPSANASRRGSHVEEGRVVSHSSNGPAAGTLSPRSKVAPGSEASDRRSSADADLSTARTSDPEGLTSALSSLDLKGDNSDLSARRRSYVHVGTSDLDSDRREWRKRFEAEANDLSQRRASFDTTAMPSTLAAANGQRPRKTSVSKAFPSAPGSTSSGPSSPPSRVQQRVSPTPLTAASFAAFHSAGGKSSLGLEEGEHKKPAFGTSIWSNDA